MFVSLCVQNYQKSGASLIKKEIATQNKFKSSYPKFYVLLYYQFLFQPFILRSLDDKIVDLKRLAKLES